MNENRHGLLVLGLDQRSQDSEVAAGTLAATRVRFHHEDRAMRLTGRDGGTGVLFGTAGII
jgi:hypothetical protein